MNTINRHGFFLSRCAAILIALAASAANGDSPTKWRDDLYLGRGEFWKHRVPITVANPAAEACEGRPVALKVGKDLPIVGVRLEELRFVD